MDVFVETAPKRCFAGALQWPGWARSGRDEDAAIRSLVEYAPRYRTVAKAAPKDPDVRVAIRVRGGTGTEFGVPSCTLPDEEVLPEAVEAKRLVAILRASWKAFDGAAARAHGAELRKGPRGGGRDLDKMAVHVLEAEVAYLTQLGAKRPAEREDMGAVRAAVIDALSYRLRGEPVPDPNRVRKLWTPLHHIRRSSWHALDHAWEIEDRAL